MRHRNIGKGKVMSVAKAAVIEFYESKSAFVYSGDLDFFHRVIDRAGAEHVGPGTHHRVLACIRSSPLWKQHGTIPGWGGRRANTYVPIPHNIVKSPDSEK
jgi:hypothetical protein